MQDHELYRRILGIEAAWFVEAVDLKLEVQQWQVVDSEAPINLTRESGSINTYPSFSPDGNQIAFQSNRDGGGIFRSRFMARAAEQRQRRGTMQIAERPGRGS